jgi:hypothetical protein
MVLQEHSISLLTTIVVLFVEQLVTKVLDGIDSYMARDDHMLRLRAWINCGSVLRFNGDKPE